MTPFRKGLIEGWLLGTLVAFAPAFWVYWAIAMIALAKPPKASRHVSHDASAAGELINRSEAARGGAVVASLLRHAKPEFDKAIAIVWRSEYSMLVDPPTIEWVEGDALNCNDGEGWIEPNINNTTETGCVTGAFSQPYRVRVAWKRSGKFSDTSLAHELAHARHYMDTGEVQYNHSGYDFAPRGRVERANAALRKSRL